MPFAWNESKTMSWCKTSCRYTVYIGTIWYFELSYIMQTAGNVMRSLLLKLADTAASLTDSQLKKEGIVWALPVSTRGLLLDIKASFSPANCLSDVPLPPNLVTNFPLDWKMKTQQALLSTVMMCPFLSTATPFGPMSRPAPILFCEGGRQRGF